MISEFIGQKLLQSLPLLWLRGMCDPRSPAYSAPVSIVTTGSPSLSYCRHEALLQGLSKQLGISIHIKMQEFTQYKCCILH